MKLILFSKKEFNITKGEAEIIERALLSEVKFLKIGDAVINTNAIEGVFGSGEPEPIMDSSRLIEASKERPRDLESIKKILDKMREDLQKKGILRLPD